MDIIISSEMKFNIAKSIIVKLFNQKLITIDEFSIIINKLASTYGITSDNKKSDLEIDFFWRTQKNQKNRVMLFEYYDRVYVSKVYFNKDHGGFFFINEEPLYFTKANAENLIFKGVYASTLKKDLVIENFF